MNGPSLPGAGEAAESLSTPSLGITMADERDRPLSLRSRFQLPLSGSREGRFPVEAPLPLGTGLSTPSLGITKVFGPRECRARRIVAFNSLSRDHLTEQR